MSEPECEHPTEQVLELSGGRRRYTCLGCRRVRYLDPPREWGTFNRSSVGGLARLIDPGSETKEG